MEKVSERSNVLTESKNQSFVHAVINAVTKGYADKIVLEDLMELVKKREVSKGVILSSPAALKAYGDSIKKSLDFIAEHLSKLEVIDEPTVRMKKDDDQDDENIIEEEIEQIDEDTGDKKKEDKKEEKKEDKKEEKKSSFVRFSNLDVSELWDKYFYDDKQNKMSGILSLKFNEDMTKYKTGNSISLNSEDIKKITSKIYDYYKNEYKKLKANLDEKIFKSNIRFSSLEKGEAEVEYEIQGAF